MISDQSTLETWAKGPHMACPNRFAPTLKPRVFWTTSLATLGACSRAVRDAASVVWRRVPAALKDVACGRDICSAVGVGSAIEAGSAGGVIAGGVAADGVCGGGAVEVVFGGGVSVVGAAGCVCASRCSFAMREATLTPIPSFCPKDFGSTGKV